MKNLSSSEKPRILILWSGTLDWWWSWPRMLVDSVREWVLNATIAWLVTHYPNWWVANLWKENESLFDTHIVEWFPTRKKGVDFTPEQILRIRKIYLEIVNKFWWIEKLDHILLSWWMKLVLWYPTEKVENIHPSRVDKSFWWEGKYGDKAHQHAFEAFKKGEISETALTTHYVDEEYDHWPVIAQKIIPLEWCKTWKDAKSRVVWATEHKFQLAITKALLEWDVKLKNWTVEWNESRTFDDPDIIKWGKNWDV